MPGTPTVSPIVGIPGQPGESINRGILGDVEAILKTFKVKVTDGYSLDPVHKSAGEHPVGLATDVVPDTAHGGTWDDVDRLAAFAVKHPATFRWIGYDGRFGTSAAPGHGRGLHLHLSWHGRDGKTPMRLTGNSSGGGPSLGDLGAIATGAGAALAGAAGPIPLLGGAIAAAGAGAGGVADTAKDVATAPARLAVKAIVDQLGSTGARLLLVAVLIFAGTALVVTGVSRLTGVNPVKAAGKAVTTAAVVVPK